MMERTFSQCCSDCGRTLLSCVCVANLSDLANTCALAPAPDCACGEQLVWSAGAWWCPSCDDLDGQGAAQ